MITSPLSWVFVLIVIAFLLKKKSFKRICYGLAILVFLIFSSPALFNLYAGWFQPRPVELRTNSGYSVGIIAGGFGSADRDGGGYFNSSSDRFLQTVKLYKTGVIKHILISGGNSKQNDRTFREAAWAKQQMVQFGIPDSVIYTEDRSKNTKENAMNAKTILDSLDLPQPYVLITSAFHIPRAMKLFGRQGMQMIAYPCNYTEGRGAFKFSELIPNIGVMSSWSRYIKESAWMVVKGG